MIIAVLKEKRAGERRVALTPDTAARLTKAGFRVRVEAGAGAEAFFTDETYVQTGAEIVTGVERLLKDADILVKVNPPQEREAGHEADLIREGAAFIGFLNPLTDPLPVKRLAQRKVTAFGMELIPRLARAQSMDALTSQASVAGYKAALVAACGLGKFFPMMTTAAGTIPPARVLVLGAGVAGLQAIATAHRLGAIVEAFDIRPAVKEEVQSLGAKFLEVELPAGEFGSAGEYAREVPEEVRRREREMLKEHVGLADAVITTAVVPGKKAPLLLTRDMVEGMRPGALIVDMAAEQGGNCELTRPGIDRVHQGVIISGPMNLPSMLSNQASQMYARNILAFLTYLVKDGNLRLDFDDEIIGSTCVTHEGAIRHEKVRAMVSSKG
ncbi:MAG: NAD(P) transhydrogenase subunit alpha [Nitrospirae bacterium GWD2_57_9]|nr:MAG: NAD(P) transhydrogenase subunit alpha [Nitrospirae bacterium GWD2_57_9]OGW47104.1 MAG: NAD(P) transhydrogenase subunit alpha [Nitrospirae bacterium GWC2_57_9]